MIRRATKDDEIHVLKFCKNTFSWGDYIDQIWNFWLSEDNFFVYENEYPIGVCHAFFLPNQIWLEGIRIDPSFRRKQIASKLIKHVEKLGKEKNLFLAYMLVESTNSSSLQMADSLKYFISQTWDFYSLQPKKNPNHDEISFAKSLNLELHTYYVKSWRWIWLDNETVSTLCDEKKIIQSSKNDKTSTAILCDSDHFPKTLIVTLFSGSFETTLELINYIQDFSACKNYERIQILTKDKLLSLDSLEYKLTFHLMKKFLT